MFNSTKTILYITKTHIHAAKVSGNKEFTKEQINDFEWNESSLTQALSEIKKMYGDTVHVVVSEELVYVTSMPVNDGEKQRSQIQQKAQEFIPEDLNTVPWDFKEILETDSSTKIIQVAALVQSFAQQLAQSATEAGLKIDTLEPLSYTLAYQIRENPDPVIVVHNDGTTLVVVIHKGLVVLSQSFSREVEEADIISFLNIAKDYFNLIPTVVLLSNTQLPFSAEKLAEHHLTSQEKSLDGMFGLAELSAVRGNDEKVLNVQLKQLPKIINTQESAEVTTDETSKETVSEVQPPKKPWKWILIIAIGAILIIGGSIFAYRLFKKNQSTAEKIPATKTTISPSQASSNNEQKDNSDNIIDKKKYPLVILNGSGVSGEAKRIGDLFTADGYEVTELGNAENNDFTVTEIRIKETVEEGFVSSIDKLLKESYSDTKIEKLPDDTDQNIVIILGQNSL